MNGSTRGLKRIWESLPLTPEIDWYLVRGQRLDNHGRLRGLKRDMSRWVQQARETELAKTQAPKKLLFFTMIPIWVRYASLLATAYAGMGHQVTLAYLPHTEWSEETSRYQLQLRNLQLKTAYASAAPLVQIAPWFEYEQKTALPSALAEKIAAVSIRDYQYTHQVEVVDESDGFFSLRQRSNLAAAKAAYAWMLAHKPDVVVVPNGLILELGAVFEVAQYLGIRTVTYEFGEQKDRLWLAQDEPVMLQKTAKMWETARLHPFTQEKQERIKELYASRRQAGLWQNFSRKWQDVPTEGKKAVREKLGLDDRPIILMAANVIGDSLTLGRQVFSDSMTEWIARTLEFLKEKTDVQFVLRIHPGERYTTGPSVADIVGEFLPKVPDHFRIIAAQDPVNTYDLIAAADLGLVYTTTVGMEMGMYGLPAVVVGNTHYRRKGFTLDPDSWDAYFDLLRAALAQPEKIQLTEKQVELAWQYAYNFFFEYPRPFPWHLRHLTEDLEAWPVSRVLSAEGMAAFQSSFDLLAGESVPWEQLLADEIVREGGAHVSD